MQERKIMPERFCTLDDNMSLEKLILAQNNKEPIIGRITMWDYPNKVFHVDLGNGLCGIIPIDDVSIYPVLNKYNKFKSSMLDKIGKNIFATIKSISIDDPNNSVITLSRKESMLDAFNVILNSIDKTIECCITSFCQFGVFVDVGNGLTGLIHWRDLSVARVRKYSELGLNIGDKINVKVLSANPNNFQVNLSYKDLFENMSFSLSHNDIIPVTILEQLNHDGYFGYLNPNTPVLINVPHDFKCKYGDKIVARVKSPKKAHPERLNLEFVSFE